MILHDHNILKFNIMLDNTDPMKFIYFLEFFYKLDIEFLEYQIPKYLPKYSMVGRE